MKPNSQNDLRKTWSRPQSAEARIWLPKQMPNMGYFPFGCVENQPMLAVNEVLVLVGTVRTAGQEYPVVPSSVSGKSPS